MKSLLIIVVSDRGRMARIKGAKSRSKRNKCLMKARRGLVAITNRGNNCYYPVRVIQVVEVIQGVRVIQVIQVVQATSPPPSPEDQKTK